MIRTQIYITDTQRDNLSELSKATGKNQSELIREAIDKLIDKESLNQRRLVLKNAAGMWKNRKDLPDYDTVRREWDRD